MLMLDWQAFLIALLLCILVGAGGWVRSLKTNDVSIVDSLWSLMFFLIVITYYFAGEISGPRHDLEVVSAR